VGGCGGGGGGGGGGEKRTFFFFFSNKLSCPRWKEIWVSSVLISIIIISSINNAPAFNLSTLDFNVQCFRNQEKASTPLLQHATGEPAVTHPYMPIKRLLLNTRRMGDFLALKIRPAY